MSIKDLVEYEKFVDKYNSRLDDAANLAREQWESKGYGGQLFSLATGAAAKGIARAVTGKSEDIRAFEKHFANYLCGDSQNAREYLLRYATEFGGRDEGLVAVAGAVRTRFWISEFAKHNRSK